MIRNIQRTWFEVWGEEMAQNRILKGLLLLLIVLSAIQTMALVVLSLRMPMVVAVSSSDSRSLLEVPAGLEVIEREARRVVARYAQAHHEWDYSNINEKMREAAKLVHSDFEKQFSKANREQIKIAKEKKVAQKFYVSDLQIDMMSRTATLSGDRILIIEGLRATNPMSLEIAFDLGPRTEANPEGIYVTSEKLIQANVTQPN